MVNHSLVDQRPFSSAAMQGQALTATAGQAGAGQGSIMAWKGVHASLAAAARGLGSTNASLHGLHNSCCLNSCAAPQMHCRGLVQTSGPMMKPGVCAAAGSFKAQITTSGEDALAATATRSSAVAGGDCCAPGEPLAERPFLHSCRGADLLQWRESAAARVTEGVRDAFSAAEGGGPTQGELLRELDWLLEDAIGRAALDDLRASRPRVSSSKLDHLPCASDSSHQTDPRALSRASQQTVPARASLAELESLWRRRLGDREPLQYLVGAAHWRDMLLAVRPGVLIPRPETEVLPDLALRALEANPELASKPWADLGTGSGALAAALAQALLKCRQRLQGGGSRAGAEEMGQVSMPGTGIAGTMGRTATWLPGGTVRTEDSVGGAEEKGDGGVLVWAVDCSDVAVATATQNMKRLQLQDHVRVVKGSWFEPLAARGLEGSLGGVLSNPPYIPSARMPTLQVEVGKHEPWLALDGGQGPGLDSLNTICQDAARFLCPGGFLALEIDLWLPDARHSSVQLRKQKYLCTSIVERLCPRMQTDGPSQAHQLARMFEGALSPISATTTHESTGQGGRSGAAIVASPTQGDSQRLPCFVDVSVVADQFGVERFVTASYAPQ